LITDGVDGVLVTADDIDALAASLRRVLGDAALRDALGMASRRTTRERYSIQRILSQWDALFATVRARTGAEAAR
jgi:GalNAc-alpha-(1->4)-GalNAc-alpha-(1->3)-diNAcBac-PP-undecaprenol alpha-1,4-N-acetyl-D-galactosaminyltransferase